MRTLKISLLVFILYISISAQEGWFWQNPLPTGNHLYGVFFFDSLTGFVVGNIGTILKTTDGGNNWNFIPSGNNNYLRVVSFADSYDGTIVGSSGTILKTTDSGNDWFNQVSGTDKNLNDISLSDQNIGTIVGQSGTILRTTDGGINWTSQNGGVGLDLFGVYFTDPNNGIAVGGSIPPYPGWSSYGVIIKTTNGGYSWSTILSSSTCYFKVFFIDSNIGWIVGFVGTILKTTDGGIITELEENAENYSKPPENFLLKQNYPNPFNPTTKIKYEIPASLNPSKGGTLVKLIVYDILGSEITVLVNEEKQPGVYESVFDGSNLPSGVYLYRLTIGQFSDTKKLVLLK